METELKVVLKRKYTVDKGDIDVLAALLSSLAAEKRQPAEEYLKELMGEDAHLCYSIRFVKDYRLICLPEEIDYSQVGKVVIVIAAPDSEQARKAEDYIGGMLYARWKGDKNIVTYKRKQVNAFLRVDVIIAGRKKLVLQSEQIGFDDILKEGDGEAIDDEFFSERATPITDKIFKQIEKAKKKKVLMPSPKDLYRRIEEEVFGQEATKKSLSVILYQHLKRKGLRKNIKKDNALLIGPTGCGKTLIAKTLAGIAGVPFLRIDATSLVQRGYRGGAHVEQLVSLFLSAADGNRKEAEYGIIFIDEIDKLACSGPCLGDIATEGVQMDLLSLIDGGNIFYEPDECEYNRVEFSFKNVLFLFGGAFSRLDDHDEISRKDLVRFGFIPEFANRLGGIIRLEPFSDDLVKHMVKREIEAYGNYLSLSREEKNVYVEIIHSTILASKEHEELGGRCVGPKVRSFFEDRIFEQEVKSGGKEKD